MVGCPKSLETMIGKTSEDSAARLQDMEDMILNLLLHLISIALTQSFLDGIFNGFYVLEKRCSLLVK
jgi:hypothetical protein